MNIEHEDRYLVAMDENLLDFISSNKTYDVITQAYYNSGKGSHRIRTTRNINNDLKGYITFKFPSNNDNSIREEYEYEISYADAEEIIEKSSLPTIVKYRYTYLSDNEKTIYIDLFTGNNQGVIIAEVEWKLPNVNKAFLGKISWIKSNINDFRPLSNYSLCFNPFSSLSQLHRSKIYTHLTSYIYTQYLIED